MDVVERSKLIEHHYQQVAHYQQQIDYHMGQIKQLGANLEKKPPEKSSGFCGEIGAVRNKADHYNSFLGNSYWEKQMKDVTNISKNRNYRSMENMINPELAPMPVTSNGYIQTRRKNTNTLPRRTHGNKPRLIGAIIKPEIVYELRSNISEYKSRIINMNIAAESSTLIEYNYQQVMLHLRKIDCNLGQIVKLTMELFASELQKSNRSRGVKNQEVDHQNNLLSNSYWEQRIKEIDEIFEGSAKVSKNRNYRSMENLIGKELAPMIAFVDSRSKSTDILFEYEMLI